jgi:transcription elongation factor Elf1
MPAILHTAKFDPSDSPARILQDLVCPACGREDPADACNRITDNKLRIFCDGCGAFATILLNDEQVRAIHRGRIGERTRG